MASPQEVLADVVKKCAKYQTSASGSSISAVVALPDRCVGPKSIVAEAVGAKGQFLSLRPVELAVVLRSICLLWLYWAQSARTLAPREGRFWG